jgi:hypothetical protein
MLKLFFSQLTSLLLLTVSNLIRFRRCSLSAAKIDSFTYHNDISQRGHPRGSALLISILLMSFVIVFGLGISSLIVDSVRVERNVIEAGKAYFAAEGGVEEALYWHENALPGYSVLDDYEFENDATMEYDLVASEEVVPCAHRDEWRVLAPRESVSLPLFYGEDVAVRGDVTEFEVTYELDYGTDWPNPYENALRWKILGLDTDGDMETEAVSEIEDYDPNNPIPLNQADVGSHYDQDPVPYYTNDPSHPISTFLENHILNYLVLANLTTKYDLKFKLTADVATCEYALIKADGLSHGAIQSIDVQVKLDSFLPVFDFVLYQTDNEF